MLFRSSRRTLFTGAVARGDFDGDQWGLRARLGRTFDYQGVDLTPYAALQYAHTNIDGYTETGAGLASLTVGDEDYDFMQSALGLSVSKRFETTNGVSIVPEVHAAWLHEFADEQQANTSSFVAGGASFSTRGLDPANDSANIGASLSILATERIDVRAAYDFEVKSDYDSHAGQLVLRYRF